MEKTSWINLVDRLNKQIIKEHDQDYGETVNVKNNLDTLSTKNPEYYKKVNKDLGMTICGNIETVDNRNRCKKYYFMCLYKKLRDKYNKDSIEECWYESIRRNNIDDYKYFDYFMNTTIIKKKAFYKEEINLITLPYSVITIETQAFYRCRSLASVVFPDALKTIGNSAFRSCSSLRSVVFPDALKTIGRRAFYKCSSLASVVFLGALQTIEVYAFSDCSSLASVTFPKSMENIINRAFFKYRYHSASKSKKSKILFISK